MTEENKKPVEASQPEASKPAVSTPVPTAAKPATPVTPAASVSTPVPAAAASVAAQTPSAVKPVVTPGVKPATAGKPASAERRQFMITWLGFAWTIFAVATATALSTCLRFMFPNVLFEPKMAFKIGAPDSYESGKVDTRWEDKYGVWIVRSPEGIYALSTVCTHLGCKPSWYDGEQKFKCPCHGSGFYKSGINFEGPAPRPLERFSIMLADDGQILVDKSKKFQYEKGEWSNPLSLLSV